MTRTHHMISCARIFLRIASLIIYHQSYKIIIQVYESLHLSVKCFVHSWLVRLEHKEVTSLWVLHFMARYQCVDMCSSHCYQRDAWPKFVDLNILLQGWMECPNTYTNVYSTFTHVLSHNMQINLTGVVQCKMHSHRHTQTHRYRQTRTDTDTHTHTQGGGRERERELNTTMLKQVYLIRLYMYSWAFDSVEKSV